MTDNNAVVIPASVLINDVKVVGRVMDKIGKDISPEAFGVVIDKYTESFERISHVLKNDNAELAKTVEQIKKATENRKYQHTIDTIKKREKSRIRQSEYIANRSSQLNREKYQNASKLEAERTANKLRLEDARRANAEYLMLKRKELRSTKSFAEDPIGYFKNVLGGKALSGLTNTFNSLGGYFTKKGVRARGGLSVEDWGKLRYGKAPGKGYDLFGKMFTNLGSALSKVSIGAMAAGVGILVAGVTFVSKKILKVGKTIVSYFANIAKQAETVKALMELIALPFKIIFTLMAVPLLTAFIPVLENMLQWISDNQDTIQAIGETLAKIFTEVFKPETMEIVTHLLNGFAVVLNFLATSIAENMKSVNTNSVASFIASTITAIAGVIQDVLMGIVAFCYSAEGQAFIVSLSESIGRIIGTLVVLLIEMIPVFLEILVVTVVGIIKGMWDVLVKQIASILDIIDGVTGGLFTNMANSIINVVNWFIDRINSVIGFLNNFGIGGSQMQHIDTWGYNGVGSNFGNAATSLTNSTSISSVFNITNNNNVSNSDTMKAIFMTGGM